MPTTITGAIRRLDGAPEPSAYLTATLTTQGGENTAILAGGPVGRGANIQGQIMLPLEIKTETEVRLRLAVPGRTLREATVRLKPGMAYSLTSVLSGAPEPTPSPTTDVHLSDDGDSATINGVASHDGDTVTIGG